MNENSCHVFRGMYGDIGFTMNDKEKVYGKID